MWDVFKKEGKAKEPCCRYADNIDGATKDPFGGIMPPCIVIEKGESLQDRVQNCRIDFFTVAQVGTLICIAFYLEAYQTLRCVN